MNHVKGRMESVSLFAVYVCYLTLKNHFFKVKKSRKEQDVLVTVLTSFHKMLNALLQETANLVLWCRCILDRGVSFLRENLWDAHKDKRVFYRRYITAAAHWKHWPTFLHTVTCSTVAEREEAGGLCFPNAAWREELGDRRSTTSHSEPFWMSQMSP